MLFCFLLKKKKRQGASSLQNSTEVGMPLTNIHSLYLNIGLSPELKTKTMYFWPMQVFSFSLPIQWLLCGITIFPSTCKDPVQSNGPSLALRNHRNFRLYKFCSDETF